MAFGPDKPGREPQDPQDPQAQAVGGSPPGVTRVPRAPALQPGHVLLPQQGASHGIELAGGDLEVGLVATSLRTEGILDGFTMVLDGFTVVLDGFTVVLDGFTMVNYYGLLRFPMVYYGFIWFHMGYHGISWDNTMWGPR